MGGRRLKTRAERNGFGVVGVEREASKAMTGRVPRRNGAPQATENNRHAHPNDDDRRVLRRAQKRSRRATR